MLQLRGISKQYVTGDFTQVALDEISLHFRHNEFVAISGPSGSGKTTCLNIIGGLDQYDEGDLIINGKSTEKFKAADWDAYRNNSIGFIFQSYNLISHLRILDNVEMGMTLSGVSTSEKRKKAIEVLTRVGLKDHIYKKPNQLSGGQMQRVAIARALANNPDIILADEPTGALDTHTSEQILQLIKEIAKDKLVIMVTHNAKLAEEYADRIVTFQDGKVISDSNPYESASKTQDYKLKKTSMSFFTALKLSGTNIAKKKWRTALTAFAASIGIIGIGLVLALSNGFNQKIDEFESDALAGAPISITQTQVSFDMTTMDFSKDMSDYKEFTDAKKIYAYNILDNQDVHYNLFTEDYVSYLEDIDPTLLSGISYYRGCSMNLLTMSSDVVTTVGTTQVELSPYPSVTQEGEESYVEKNYDLLSGTYPSGPNDLILVVDTYNCLSTSILDALGLDYSAESIPFEDIIGKEIKMIYNNDYYTQSGDTFVVNGDPSDLTSLYNNPNAQTLTIVGIVRQREDATYSVLSPGVCYSDELALQFIQDAQNSDIVLAQESCDYNVLTGETFADASGFNLASMMGLSTSTSKDSVLSALGATSIPYAILLYPNNFADKEEVLTYLDDWNSDKSDTDQILYTDMAAQMTELAGGIMDAITYVLVAFASISLVVSSIMIGIITYISVLERTKEIGVLRALGARKKDISRVFTAETFIIGAFSGGLGILIASLLTIPANYIIEKLTDLPDVAKLNPLHAVGLVLISILLTLIGGYIPSKIAAKKNPVEALRSE